MTKIWIILIIIRTLYFSKNPINLFSKILLDFFFFITYAQGFHSLPLSLV